MKPMRKLINNKTTYRKLLQSLPASLAAIVFVIYLHSFAPLTADRQRRAAALVESESYVEITADGQAVAWCRGIRCDGLPEHMALKADSSVVRYAYLNGLWVNKYPLMPSCKGLLLIADGGNAEYRKLPATDKNTSTVIAKAITFTAERVKLMEQKKEEADYYMRVHNVNDDGFNVVAEYAARLKAEHDEAIRLLAVLKSLQAKKKVEIRQVRRYTLLYCDTSAAVKRKACRALTAYGQKPFILLQTSDGKRPEGAAAVYFHQWLTPHPDTGDSINVTSIPGCTEYGFNPSQPKTATFGGTMADGLRHDLPQLLAPDGCAVYTPEGFLIGISSGGRIFRPKYFGYGLKHMLE